MPEFDYKQRPWARAITDEEYDRAVGRAVPLTCVVIDKEILHGFKGRALRAYPVEYGELLWGFIEEDTAYVTSIERVDAEADEDSIQLDPDDDFGDRVGSQTLLGTIHSHPDCGSEPSPDDIENASEPPPEIVFGICSIRKFPRRRMVAFAFYQADGTPVEYSVAEND